MKSVSDSLQRYEKDTEATSPEWAQHHVSVVRSLLYPPGIKSISPLVRDKVATLNTQRQSMLENVKCI